MVLATDENADAQPKEKKCPRHEAWGSNSQHGQFEMESHSPYRNVEPQSMALIHVNREFAVVSKGIRDA
jgi:hypothetical protein